MFTAFNLIIYLSGIHKVISSTAIGCTKNEETRTSGIQQFTVCKTTSKVTLSAYIKKSHRKKKQFESIRLEKCLFRIRNLGLGIPHLPSVANRPFRSRRYRKISFLNNTERIKIVDQIFSRLKING